MILPELREEVYAGHLELPKNDLVKMTSGNVSGRDPLTGLVVIKPSGVPYEKLTPGNLVVLNLEGRVIEGELTPSIDTCTHLYIYRHRPDVNGVVHTHSPYASSFAVLGQCIPACLTTCGLLGGDVPLGRYFPPVGDERIGEEIVRVAGSSLAVLMQNHGVFTLGESPGQAVRVAIEVEEIAKITRLAMLGGEPIRLSPAQVAEMVSNYRDKYGQH